MSTFKVKTNSKGPSRALARLQSSLGDLTPAMQNASKELTARVWYRFAFKRDPDNQKWAPWSPATRAAAKPGQKLMLNTRALRDSVRFIPARDGIRVRLGVPYARFHEQPFARQRLGAIPRRAFVFSAKNNGRGLSEADERYVHNAIRYQLRKAVKQ